MSTLTKTPDPTLDLVTKIVTQPTFDPKEFERVKGDRMTALELRRDRPREVAALMLNAALYELESAYGHPTTGTREKTDMILYRRTFAAGVSPSVECGSCHDLHNYSNPTFLRVANNTSNLCLSCHTK